MLQTKAKIELPSTTFSFYCNYITCEVNISTIRTSFNLIMVRVEKQVKKMSMKVTDNIDSSLVFISIMFSDHNIATGVI